MKMPSFASSYQAGSRWVATAPSQACTWAEATPTAGAASDCRSHPDCRSNPDCRTHPAADDPSQRQPSQSVLRR